MADPTARDLIQRLTDYVESSQETYCVPTQHLIAEARAYLATPEFAAGPTDEELVCAAEEAGFCFEINGHLFNSRYAYSDIKREVLSFARAVLSQFGGANG